MKNRILDSLSTFGNPAIDTSNDPMFLELVDELGIDPKELERKSAQTLKLVLHNYDFFEISTIDKFNHKIIKTFAKDLRIAQGFEVELDDRLLLEQAIAQLFTKVNDDELLAKTLINFSLEKVDANKSWNIIKDLIEVGKLLFEEIHFHELKTIENKTIGAFGDMQIALVKKMDSLSGRAVELAGKAQKTIVKNGFEDQDFSRGTLPNHFRKIALGESNTTLLYKNKLEQNITNSDVLLKSVQKDPTTLCIQLLPIYLEIKAILFQKKFFKNAYSNILPLTVLNEIAKQVSILQKEKDILHISEFNKLIFKEIAHQPVPYIYERLGEKYRYHFIDEFQDTSTMQWRNLIPLIGNALETEDLNGEKGSLLLVGDTKQSIYRWRGGNPLQFLNLTNKAASPFTIPPKVLDLKTNWRSFDTIINFNNAFFDLTSSMLTEAEHRNLYTTQSHQKSNHKKGGYVELDFVGDSTNENSGPYSEKVLLAIKRILSKGFSYGDICILVRKNKHGVVLANYLAEHQIPIVSSEALLLANSPEVRFLTALLRYMDNPHEQALEYEVLIYLFAESAQKHNMVVQHLGNLNQTLKKKYSFDIREELGHPLLSILENAIAAFNLSSKSNAHVIHFLDLALEVSEKEGVGIYGFLEYWDLRQDKLAVPTPEGQDSARIMTIHKAKGLEFPFVIFPYADGKLSATGRQKKLWVPLLEEKGLGFDKVLVNISQDLEHYSEYSKSAHHIEKSLSELDEINVLYVALTRAIRGLFIFSKESNSNTYGTLFKKYLEHHRYWDSNQSVYSFGNFAENDKKTISRVNTTIPYIYTGRNGLANNLAISSQSSWEPDKNEALEYGNRLHNILANIHSKESIESAMELEKVSGNLNQQELDSYSKIIFKIIEHPELSNYYQGAANAKNEVELMDGLGRTFRPDRLVFHSSQVTIIDYKTGVFDPKHKTQVETYAAILEEMNYVVSNKILVYIGSTIEPVFI